jgi:hypothetical protein
MARKPDRSVLKDSGKRRKFGTGAVRDLALGKGRFDLLAFAGVFAQAIQMERGAIKYAARNWEKGMHLSNFVSSAFRHLIKFVMGFDDEPHLDAAIWNLNCLAEGIKRIEHGLWPKNLDDLPKTWKGKKPWF